MDDVQTSKAPLDGAIPLLAALDDLLDKERKSLLAGDLDGISRSLHEKEQLIDGLNAMGLHRDLELSGLKEKLSRNQVLLDGALDGISAVVGRIATLRRIRSTLETYDKAGRRMTIEATRASQVEKRA